MDTRDKVFSLYKTLEFAVRRKIPELPAGKSAVWLYMQVSPAYKAGVLDNIRKYRNATHGHGVGPAYMPAPEWIGFLENEIKTVDRSGAELTQKLRVAMKKANEGSLRRPTSGTRTPSGGQRPQRVPYENQRTPRQAPAKPKSEPFERASGADGNLKVRASLEKGDGRYTKGLFNKKSMMNFRLRVAIQNQDGLKISSIKAILKGKNAIVEKIIPARLQSVTEFDLPTDTFGGHIEAVIYVDYKIGLFKHKQMKLTVSKNF